MQKKTFIFIMIIICISTFLTKLGFSEKSNEAKNENKWKELIKSEEVKDRELARGILFNERKDAIDFLLSIVNSPLKEGEEFYDSYNTRNTAIYFLGTFRAKEAVQALTQWLVAKHGQGMTVDEQGLFVPAGSALVEIGLPSVKPVIDRLKQGEVEYGYLFYNECLKVLVCIKGISETENLIESAIAKETDSEKKKNLQFGLEFLKDPERRTWLEDLYQKINNLE
jgi:hypothetical protein